MHGFAPLFLAMVFAADPLELPKDVYEIQTKHFAIPFRVMPDYQDKIEKMRLFVSQDQGKTWKHKKDFRPNDKRVIYTPPHDGLYWFSLQVVLKNGERNPADLDDLIPNMKVYVNSEQKTLEARQSYEELQCEVEYLRKTIDELQKNIKELESNRNPK